MAPPRHDVAPGKRLPSCKRGADRILRDLRIIVRQALPKLWQVRVPVRGIVGVIGVIDVLDLEIT